MIEKEDMKPMIRRKEFDQELEELRTLLQQMGDHVAKALDGAIESLQTMDAEKAQVIIKNDANLNALEDKIMELGSKLIITQQPVAKDLRRIIVAFKISSDLERMGDLALDVAKVTLRMEGQELIKPLVDIPRMAEVVKSMVEESIESYLKENTDLAYKMAQTDDQVDQLYSNMIRDLYTLMTDHPAQASQAMLLLMVGRYIERIGDHATNIGESTVYLVTGQRPDLNQ
jgi:phosphate transport system protein